MKDTKVNETKKTLSIAEAGRELGLGKNAAYNAAHRGEIPTIKIGGRILVLRAAFDRLLERR